MIKVSDYIAKRLKEHHGVSHVFMISGGGSMHLNDSFGRYLDYTCCHHEQACAIAAEGYSRVHNRLAVVNITTGPGGLNTLTGVMGQWTDSVPVLYVSGQVKHETTIDSCRDAGLRQLGDQEADIINIVKPLTKYAVSLKKPSDVKKVIDEAVHHATTGRFGPVWVDVPMNVQGALLEEDKLEDYTPPAARPTEDLLGEQAAEAAAMIGKAKRPLVIAGYGTRLANAISFLDNILERIRVPVVTTFNGIDIVAGDNPFYTGRIGTLGTRAGNFALQNADLLLCLGTRNNIRQVSYNWENFAPGAKKIIVDIDRYELYKPTVKADLPIHAGVGMFLGAFAEQLKHYTPLHEGWLQWCLERRKRYPVLREHPLVKDDRINPYRFIDALSDQLQHNSLVVTGDGTACVASFQAFKIKKGQRVFWNSGCAAMGYDLPAAIGACIASDKRNTVCITGDGSFQMNIQELQTIIHHRLPVKIFYLDNGGYLSIMQTQNSYFEGRKVACDPASGVSFPDVKKITAAYGMDYFMTGSYETMNEAIEKTLLSPSPSLCEVKLTADYTFKPKLSSVKTDDGRMISKPLEDMYPFLDRDELRSNMIE